MKLARVVSVYNEAKATLKIEMHDASTPTNRFITIPFGDLKPGMVFANGKLVILELSISALGSGSSSSGSDAFLTLELE